MNGEVLSRHTCLPWRFSASRGTPVRGAITPLLWSAFIVAVKFYVKAAFVSVGREGGLSLLSSRDFRRRRAKRNGCPPATVDHAQIWAATMPSQHSLQQPFIRILTECPTCGLPSSHMRASIASRRMQETRSAILDAGLCYVILEVLRYLRYARREQGRRAGRKESARIGTSQ